MSQYLERHSLYPPLISSLPAAELGMVIIIPAFNEPDCQSSLQALADCTPPRCAVEVILLLNDAENSAPHIQALHQQQLPALRQWAEAHNRPGLQFHILHCAKLPARHAGVGLARKIGMDEALRRLLQVKRPDGLLVAFDADSRCTPNYLQAIEQHFAQSPRCPAASLYFEHPLSGCDFPPAIYQAITEYELHLRYFNNAKRYAGFPFAYETVGSAMAVRASAYAQQGGMNRRKAGEDFYFLHKFTPLGHYGEINDTCVIPSPRISDRVPFGTGRAVGQLLDSNIPLTTYALPTFEALRGFFAAIESWYDCSPAQAEAQLVGLAPPLAQFLVQQQFRDKLEELQRHTSNPASFRQRFFRWFNAFRIMKYVHAAREAAYPAVPVMVAAGQLAEQLSGEPRGGAAAAEELLIWCRGLGRDKRWGVYVNG
ncbi:MAG: hypothetical protein AAGG75_23855 [Bacteroidota bacterium]